MAARGDEGVGRRVEANRAALLRDRLVPWVDKMLAFLGPPAKADRDAEHVHALFLKPFRNNERRSGLINPSEGRNLANWTAALERNGCQEEPS